MTEASSPRVTPYTTALTAGATVTATIANSPGQSRYDWVAFYPVGNGTSGFIGNDKYLNNSSVPPASPLTGGDVTFATSPSLPSGSYNIRLISADGSTLA